MQPRTEFLEDERVHRLLCAGDRQEAAAFLGRHLESLYAFVHFRVGGDRALAEDVVQDTLLTGLEKLRTWDGRASLYSWLCGIAKNKIRTHRRKRRPVLVEDLLDEADGEIDAILARVDREDLPEWVLERQETQELVGATLSSLPTDYRQALLDKYVERKSVREIAAATGRGEKAAESTLHRARLAFARVFQLLAKRRGGLDHGELE